MSRLAELQEQLNEAGAMLAQLDRAIAGDPHSPSLAAMARSMRKRLQGLEEMFLSAAEEMSEDVCNYRLFADEGPPLLKGIASAMSDFQSFVSIVHEAKTHGPRQKESVGPDTAKATAFGFAYAYTGSVGFVLTLPNERMLVGESPLDETMAVVFSMAQAKDSGEVSLYAKELGAAPVRALYRWAGDHVKYGLGADIEWRRHGEIRGKLFIQRPELVELQHLLDQTSDEVVDTVTVTGSLKAGDIDRHTFRLELPDGSEIRGKASEALGERTGAVLGGRYEATIRTTTRTRFSADKDEVDYDLIGLRRLD